MKVFPTLRVSGSPERIGTDIGKALGPQIRDVFALYSQLIAEGFKVDPLSATYTSEMERRAGLYQALIRQHLPQYAEEIEAMARACNLPAWKLYFVNARTEILCEGWSNGTLAGTPGECTLFAVPALGLLGQSWDWHPALESLIRVIDMEPDGAPRRIFMAEPGIIGKAGLNQNGVGLLLAILFGKLEGKIGIPIHVLLRLVLDCESVAIAEKAIEFLPRNTFSAIAMSDSTLNYRMFEFHREKMFRISDVIHTNHYRGRTESDPLPASVERLQQAGILHVNLNSVESMIAAVTNQDGRGQPICRTYGDGFRFPVGTVASLVIQSPEKIFHIVRSPADVPATWTQHRFN